MKVIISKNEIIASNEVVVTLMTNIDILKGSARKEIKAAAEQAEQDFPKFVSELQKKVIEAGDSNKVIITHGREDGEEFIVFDLNPDYYIGHLKLAVKYAKPIANTINSVVGLLLACKSAFENMGFIMKGYEDETKKLEKEFSTKKD